MLTQTAKKKKLPGGGCAPFHIRISFQKSEQNNSDVNKIIEEKRAYVTLSHSHSVVKEKRRKTTTCNPSEMHSALHHADKLLRDKKQ